MVLSRGRPLFLTQIEWDLTLIRTSQIKVRKVSSFGHYMYSEYIRVVQIEKKRVWIFIAEIYASSVHSWRLSILSVDFSRWSCLVLICFPRLFSFSLILHFWFCHDCHTCESMKLSVLGVELCVWLQLYNSTFVNEL